MRKRMGKFQKKIGILLTMSMIASTLVAGCGEKNTTDSTETSSKEVSTTTSTTETAVGTLPISKEPITLTVFVPANGENRWEDNLQTKELEEKTNIKIEWIVAAASDNIKDKLSTMFASGEMPDIIMTGVGNSNRYDKATEAMLGAQGLVLPLNDYLDTISVGYKTAFEKLEGMRDYITTPDGNIYSLPNVDGSLHVQYNMKLWINTEWLDNLNLEMPTTTDEFYEVMKAFKEQDANGNGDPNDEIPLSTVTSGAGTQVDGFLMSPFELTPETNKMFLSDGTITFAPIQEGYKEGLKYLNKLYTEGLLNPESFTQDKDNQVNINEAGEDCVIGAFLAQRPGYACDLTTEPYSTKWEQYQSLAPLTGPSGQCIAAWNPYVMYQTGMTFISSSCKNPVAAFRFLDYLATEEESMRSSFGVEGVHWRKAQEGEKDLNGNQSLYTLTGESTTNQIWGQTACVIRLPEEVVSLTTNQDPYAEGVKPLDGRQIVMYRASKEHEAVQQSIDSVLPDLYMTESDSEEMSLLKTTIMDNQREMMVQFITGQKDIDGDWDSYVKSLKDLGLDRYIQLLQGAYDVSTFAK